MRRTLVRSVIQRVLLCALAMLLALAPITGAAAATLGEPEVEAATEAATEAVAQDATEPPAVEQATEDAGAAPAEEAAEEPVAGPRAEDPEPTEAPDDTGTETPEEVTDAADAAATKEAPRAAEPALAEDDQELEAAKLEAEQVDAEQETTVRAIDFGGVPVYGDPNETRCNLIDFRYTDGHRDHFWFCGQQGDIDQTRIAALGGSMHVTELHISCSYVFGGGIIPGDPSHTISSWSIVKYRDGEVWKTCGQTFSSPPQVDIQKWIDGNKETHTINAGQDAVWTIKVTNNGGVTLTDVAVTDALAADCARPNLAASLAVDQSVTYTCTSPDVTAGFTNLARVTTAQNVSDEDTAAVAVRRPRISISKWIGDFQETQTVPYGGTAQWTIRVRNSGDQTLTAVAVTDALAPDCDRPNLAATLAPGERILYRCSSADVTAGFTNLARVTTAENVSDEDTASVTVTAPSLTAVWSCPTPGQGSVITGRTNVPLVSATLTFARGGGSQTLANIPVTGDGDFTLAGTADHAGKVISSASIVSSVPSLNQTVTATDAQINACYVDTPKITIDKRPAGWNGTPPETQAVAYDGTANWTIAVTNNGNVPLTNVRVSDPLAQACDRAGATAIGSLAVGATHVYTCSRANVTAGFTNVATATGTPPSGADVSDSDDSPVTVPTVEPAPPAIRIDKRPVGWDGTGVENQLVDAGGTANWLITVTNAGSVRLTNVRVVDALAANCDRVGANAFAALEPGQPTAYTCSLGNVSVDFVNSATATGTPPFGNDVSATDTSPVTVPRRTGPPGISLAKTAPTPTCPEPGQVVTYSFQIRNTGEQTLTNVALNDPMLGGAVTLPSTTLAAGHSMTATKSYTLTAANIAAGSLSNAATVTAQAGSGQTVSNTGNATVMLEPCGDVDLVKDGPAQASVGEQIPYTFTVTNTGTVELTDVRIFDARLQISGLLVNPSTLAPGQQGTATATYTVTEADLDAGEILNVAFVRARTPGGRTVEDDDDHITTIVTVPPGPKPRIHLEKTGPTEALEGQTITYTFTVTNTGNRTLTDVHIDDPLLGLERLPVRPSTLAPDEQGTATATYVITAANAEAGSVYNTAIARGTPPVGDDVTDDDDHTVVVPAPRCITPPCEPITPPRLPDTGMGTTGFALTALLSLALGGVLLGIAGAGNLQAAMGNATVNADSPMLAMLRRWNLAPKPGGAQARRRRRR